MFLCCVPILLFSQTYHSGGDFNTSWVRFNTVFLFFVCVIFASGVCFLFVFHIYLVLKNKTTLGVLPVVEHSIHTCIDTYTYA